MPIYDTKQLKSFLKGKDITHKMVAKQTGFAQPTVTNYINGHRKISAAFANALCKIFPEINKDFLLSYEGELLQNNSSPSETSMVYLIPTAAWGGVLSDYSPQILERDCKKIENPCVGAELAIQVYGESMAPSYPPGAIIFVKKVNQEMFIEWGRVYLLDTRNGSVLKRVAPSQSEDSIICESLNPKYSPFTVAKDDIFGMYKVLGTLILE